MPNIKPVSNLRNEATLQLFGELSKGKKSGEENGWILSQDVKKRFQAKADEK